MKLPSVSSDKLLKILVNKKGFKIIRQRGSHISLHKLTGKRNLLVVVPVKSRIKDGTLLSILKQANLTKEELLKLL